MANNVFANGREISCKKADGKTICCFPDVCMTPPENPATPPGVPVPYPNTAFSKDTSDGSKDVKISGQEIILKNKSFFKTSTGDEAGCAAKKGVMTSKIKGKAYFTAWSMDVKVEGENVVRHLDLTTHNHGSNTNTAPWPHVEKANLEGLPKKPCKKDCSDKPSKERKKKLRRKSPSSQARESVNASNPKTCAACGGNPVRLAADHIVPLKIIMQIPGFGCLSNEDQEKVSNMKENYVGLCKSCNSSKSAKLWHTWKGNKAKGLDWQSDAFKDNREKARTVTNSLITQFKAKIRNLPCN